MTPHRVQLSRKKGWRMPDNTVTVARPGKWGNPFSVMPEQAAGAKVGRYVAMPSREEAGALLEQARRELRGHNLACWCSLDGPCHAEVLLDLVNR